MDRAELTKQLERDEGLRLKPYKCSAGKLTIGIGRNLDDRGITEVEALSLLRNDIDIVEAELTKLPIYHKLDAVRQTVLANLAFNLGTPGLLKFRKMWIALDQGDFQTAANEMLNSTWAQQVGIRAARLSKMMREGVFT